MNDKQFIANFSKLPLDEKLSVYNKFFQYMPINMRHVLQRLIGLECLYHRHDEKEAKNDR